MTGTIKLAGIVWGDKFQTLYGTDKPCYPGVDGAVKYTVTDMESGEEWTFYQPFSKKGTKQISNRNVWAWNGNQQAPTLSPSFVIDCPNYFRVHLFFTSGEIHLLSDSTVTLVNQP